jgi:hypothetical protein
MATKLEIEKRGDEIKKKSSPLKLQSQSQLNFAEMRRRLKCEMLTDGRRTKSDGNSSHGLKAR